MSHDHSQNHYGPNASFDGHDSDLASAGMLIESLRQQLAAAIAACELKDEALQNCEGMLDELRDYPITHDAIIEALAIQPDDRALKAWLGEPIGEVKKHTGSLKDMAIIVWSGEQPEEGAQLYIKPKGLK